MKKMTRSAVIYIAYVCVLLAFVALGALVAALAFRSSWAIVAGVAMVGALGTAVVGFRRSSRQTGQAWSGPEGTAHIDRYLAAYRGVAQTAAKEPVTTDAQLHRAA